MKFDLTFAQDEIRLTLTESLRLSEGQSARAESPAARVAFDRLPKIESQVRQFLSGFAVDRDESR